jgi:hypothetical protein
VPRPRAVSRQVPDRGWAPGDQLCLFALTTVHALTAGTDRHAPAFLLATWSTCGLVAVLTAVRAARAGDRVLSGSGR